MQATSLLLNAIARQIGQTSHFTRWFDPSRLQVRGEWGSFILFLLALVVGLIGVGWIARLAFTHLPAADSLD